MKKVLFSILAIGVLASCTKTEPVFTEVDQEIKITPVTSMVTKAAIDGTEYPASEQFNVIGYWADQPAGTVNFGEKPTVYLDNVTFAKQEGGQYWAGADQSYYWPKNGSLRFAAYSPAEPLGGEFSHDLASDTWTATGYTQSNLTNSTIDFMVAQTPPSYTAQTAAENVSVVFEHALSWITLQVKAEDEVAAGAFTIKNITINDVNTVADMVAEYPAKVWSNWSVPAPYEVFDGSKYGSTELMPYGETAAAIIENTTAGTVVIPQATTTVTITYTQNAINGSTQLDNQVITVPLDLDDNDAPWEPGKHYIYTIIFSLDEILINPSVADWEDVTVADKNYDEFNNVSVTAGETLRVPSDVVSTTKIEVAGTLDGDGHTVQANELSEVIEGTLPFVYLNNGGAAVKDATIDGNNVSTTVGSKTYGIRNIVVGASGEYTISGVTSINATYPLYVAAEDVVLNVSNSTLQGWTSYGATTTGNFENVKFTNGAYARVRPYGTTTFKDCAFEKDFVIDLSHLAEGKSVTFDNCTYDGAALGEGNLVHEVTVSGTLVTRKGTYTIK